MSAFLSRFLNPKHVAKTTQSWQQTGQANTPANDARCVLYLQLQDGRISKAGFRAYGPPIAIACADQLCDLVTGQTTDAARALTVRDLEQALSLQASQRYAALLVLDALAAALNAD